VSGERGEVTARLDEWRAGGSDAESRLYSLVYGRLKQLARGYLRRERPDHTLQVTDLVHEAYLRVAEAEKGCGDRAHFFGVAAQAMRRILVDYARAHRAKKRGDGMKRERLGEDLFVSAAQQPEDVLEIHDALQKLARVDERQARIVELRYFAGLSIDETAEALACSDRTVKRDWRMAQAWLRRELSGDSNL
jgi:RNA polymerase sigma factor (TIGR02999 family)